MPVHHATGCDRGHGGLDWSAWVSEGPHVEDSPRFHITETYHRLLFEVGQAVDLRERIIRGKLRDRAPSALRPTERSGLLSRSRTNPTLWIDPLTLARVVEQASKSERGHPLFDVVTDPWWIERLARHCRAEFELNAQKVSALKVVQESREAASTRFFGSFTFRAMAGVIIATVGLLAAQIPKETFSELGWSEAYGWYRLALVAILFYLLITAAILSLQKQGELRTAEGELSTTRLVLALCGALSNIEDKYVGETPAAEGRPSSRSSDPDS